MGAVERFLEAAAAVGVAPEVRRFPEGTKTAADAARAVGSNVDQIVKTLVFVVDERPVLALTSGKNRVDPGKLAAVAGGASARRATPEEARAATGYAVGGTPPFGFPRTVPAYLDPDLLTFEEVWVAAGTPDSVFPISPLTLERVTGAIRADFTEG
jgi:Cys-tRNA(Pro) deacylase